MARNQAWIDEVITLGPHQIRLRRPAAVDPWLDELADRPIDHPDVVDERLPYWAEVWPSARALADYLVGEGAIQEGDEVLELGCGAGLAGIAAGLLGARVTMTDAAAPALELAAFNWRQNLGHAASVCAMDWRYPDPRLASDWVMAADVLYEERWFNPILNALRICVRPGGHALLAEPRRRVAEPFFHDLLPSGPWTVTCLPWSTEGPPPIDVDIYRLDRVQ